jgi:hypothetical protein
MRDGPHIDAKWIRQGGERSLSAPWIVYGKRGILLLLRRALKVHRQRDCKPQDFYKTPVKTCQVRS